MNGICHRVGKSDSTLGLAAGTLKRSATPSAHKKAATCVSLKRQYAVAPRAPLIEY